MSPDTTLIRRALWIAGLIAVAGVLGLGPLHRFDDADALISIFVSLWKWTPFYWGQARFGMLLPLLAWPLRDPLANLVFQSTASAFCALVSFFLAARYLVRRPTWPIAGTVGALLALGALPPRLAYLLFPCSGQPYAPSLALGLLGLLALEPAPNRSRPNRMARAAGGVGLLALASWVNGSIAAGLAPVVLGRQMLVTWPTDGWRTAARRTAAELGPVLLTGGAAAWLMRHMNDGNPYFETLPRARWPWAFHRVGRVLIEENAGSALLWVVVGVAAVGLALQAIPRVRPTARVTLGAILALSGSAAAMGFAAAINVWVMRNQFAARYVLPSGFMVFAAVGLLWDVPLGASPRRASAIPALAVGALLVLCLVRFGAPSLGGVESAVVHMAPDVSSEVVAEGCTHLIGDYWRSWPLAFLAEQKLRAQGSDQRVWVVSTRSEATAPMWRRVPRARWVLCAPVTDLDPARYMVRLDRLPPARFEPVGGLVVGRFSP